MENNKNLMSFEELCKVLKEVQNKELQQRSSFIENYKNKIYVESENNLFGDDILKENTSITDACFKMIANCMKEYCSDEKLVTDRKIERVPYITRQRPRALRYEIDEEVNNMNRIEFLKNRKNVITVDTSAGYNKYIMYKPDGITTIIINEDEFSFINLDIYRPLINVNGQQIDALSSDRKTICDLFNDKSLPKKLFTDTELSKSVKRIIGKNKYTFNESDRLSILYKNPDTGDNVIMIGDNILDTKYDANNEEVRVVSGLNNGDYLTSDDLITLIKSLSNFDIEFIKDYTKKVEENKMKFNNLLETLEVNIEKQIENEGLTRLQIGNDFMTFCNLDVMCPIVEVNGHEVKDNTFTKYITNRVLANAIRNRIMPKSLVTKIEELTGEVVYQFKPIAESNTHVNPIQISANESGHTIFEINGYTIITTIVKEIEKVRIVYMTKDGDVVNDINEILNFIKSLPQEAIDVMVTCTGEIDCEESPVIVDLNKDENDEEIDNMIKEIKDTYFKAKEELREKLNITDEMINFLINNASESNIVELFVNKFGLRFNYNKCTFEGLYGQRFYVIPFRGYIKYHLMQLKELQDAMDGILDECESDVDDNLEELILPESKIKCHIDKLGNIKYLSLKNIDKDGNELQPYCIDTEDDMNNIIKSLSDIDNEVLLSVILNLTKDKTQHTEEDEIDLISELNDIETDIPSTIPEININIIPSTPAKTLNEFIKEEINKNRKPINMHDKSFIRLLESLGFDDIKSLYMITSFYIKHISSVYDYVNEFDFTVTNFTNNDLKLEAITEGYGFEQGEEPLETGDEWALTYHGLLKLLCKLDSRVLDYPELSLKDFIESI